MLITDIAASNFWEVKFYRDEEKDQNPKKEKNKRKRTRIRKRSPFFESEIVNKRGLRFVYLYIRLLSLYSIWRPTWSLQVYSLFFFFSFFCFCIDGLFSWPKEKPKILVLGGVGMIGRNFVKWCVDNDVCSFIRVADKAMTVTSYFRYTISFTFFFLSRNLLLNADMFFFLSKRKHFPPQF